jgi:glycosyltransferase involved in cell wall biosynthesis
MQKSDQPGVVNNRPLVSVIITTFNRADRLNQAINSVLAQSYVTFELIIVDDGSTDNTKEIVAGVNDPRLVYTGFACNKGIGAARREGVQHAKGDLIAFLDSDDIWYPEKLHDQVGIFLRYPNVELLFSDYENIDILGKNQGYGFSQFKEGLSELGVDDLEPGLFLVSSGLPEAILRANFIGTASIFIFRSSIVHRIGNFNPLLSGPEDFEFLWRAMMHNVQFAYTSKVLVTRYKGADSITSGKIIFKHRFLDALELCKTMAVDTGRGFLVKNIRDTQGIIWRSLISDYAITGERKKACVAFYKSISCRFTFRAVFYFLAALAGPTLIGKVHR